MRDRDVAPYEALSEARSSADRDHLPVIATVTSARMQMPSTSTALSGDIYAANSEKYTETSSILKLPAEILLEVLSLLDVADLLSIREVRCRLCTKHASASGLLNPHLLLTTLTTTRGRSWRALRGRLR